MSIEDLNARVRHDLDVLGIGAQTWVRAREGVADVVIVGGGQSGLGAAFALRRERVTNVRIIDENPAGMEGPWLTYARMITLRTPKHLLSIDLGVPSLTFRAWWEAQYGPAGWAALDKIPREQWMGYLRWYRAVLGLQVENGVRALRIEPQPGGVHRLVTSSAAGESAILARKIILATGIQGGGEWHVPELVGNALPGSLYAHTSEAIDYKALAGKRIGILGAGASSFDNANVALESGVAEAHVFFRREALPRVNPIRFMERSGVIPNFSTLSDAEKYAAIAAFFRHNQPPTNDTFNRAAAHAGFALHPGAPWLSVRENGGGVEVTTPKGVFQFDFVVLSTGLLTDPGLRPELSELAHRIACWRDRRPPETAPDALVDAHPYLGRGFEFTPRTPEDAPFVHGLFAFNYSALITHGLSASALSGLGHALPRLASGVAGQLFRDDKESWMADYLAYDEAEFVGAWSDVQAAAE